MITKGDIMEKSIEYNDNYIPQTKEGYILIMPQGGPIQYRSKFEAERHTTLFLNGYTGGVFERKIEDAI